MTMTPAQAKQRKAQLDVKIENYRTTVKTVQAKIKEALADKAKIKPTPKPKKKETKK